MVRTSSCVTLGMLVRSLSDRPSWLVAVALVLTFAAGALVTAAVLHRGDDRCAVPAGLDAATQASLASRAMACRDLEHHRISLAEYRLLIGVDHPPAPPPMQWDASVRAFS